MTSYENQERTIRIRALNDEFRRTFQGGRIMLTQGTLRMGASKVEGNRLIREVMQFSDFRENNDPYQEHDFGALDFDGEKVFWKIDYYDIECCGGSPDPSDPNVTTRVMTIMLASEY